MNKILTGVVIIIFLVLVVMMSLRLLTGEDSWVCSQEGWVKHGFPKESALNTPCGQQKVVVYWSRIDSVDCALVFPLERLVPAETEKVTATFNALFSGPTETERAEGYNSFFSSSTRDILRVFKIKGNKAYVDLNDFRTLIPNANSSCGGQAFLAALDATVETAVPEVEMVIYSIEGSASDFYEWMQLGCSSENDWCRSPFNPVE